MKKCMLLFSFLTIMLSHSIDARTYTITNNTMGSIYGKIVPSHQVIQLYFGSKKSPRISIRPGTTQTVEVDDKMPCLTQIKKFYKPQNIFRGINNEICGDATIILEGTYPKLMAVIQMP